MKKDKTFDELLKDWKVTTRVLPPIIMEYEEIAVTDEQIFLLGGKRVKKSRD